MEKVFIYLNSEDWILLLLMGVMIFGIEQYLYFSLFESVKGTLLVDVSC